MKCPICGAWSQVLDTRGAVKRESIKRRRVCANEHKFWTFEVFPGFLHPTSAKKCLIGVEKERARWVRNVAIRKDPRPSPEVAKDYGLKPSYVRQIRNGIKGKK